MVVRPPLGRGGRSKALAGGIVAKVTEWPATVDRRYHDAVIFDLDSVVTNIDPGAVRALDSTVPMLRRLRDVGIARAVYSPTGNCADALRDAGIDELVDVTVGEVDNPGMLDSALLTAVAGRLGVRPGRCVVVAHDQAGIQAGWDGGFSLVIGLDRTGQLEELTPCGANPVISDVGEISVRSGDAAISTIPDALQLYSQLKELVAARRVAVFLDFDGTLSEIVKQPESATLVDGAADALRALAAQCPVAVVSGRGLEDVRDRINVDGLWFAGSHGFELAAPDGGRHENEAAATALGALATTSELLTRDLSEIPGVVVEHKPFGVAVHYRNADPEVVDDVVAAVHRLGHSEGLRVTTGRKVVELRPNIDWDKGTTLEWILEHIEVSDSTYGPDTVLPIYIGDDITDEDAFDAVRFDGVGIAVRHDENGDRPSAASFSLENPFAVVQFIQRLAADLEPAAESPSDPWVLVYEGYDPYSERLRETLCTVGNGYVATRGCAPRQRRPRRITRAPMPPACTTY